VSAALAFRFDREEHRYTLLNGIELPHITGMLEQTGYIDDRWYTEESSRRGTAVHKLTADFDLGALDVPSCVSPFRGYLLAHVKAMTILNAEVLDVEEPLVHPEFCFGGRPDRGWKVFGLEAIGEIKTGAPEASHRVQTALQAILRAGAKVSLLPPTQIARYALYLKDRGKFFVEEHKDRRDFDKAYEVIRKCCR
jgi:hypothetical protein